MNKSLLYLMLGFLNKPKFIIGLILSFVGTIMSLFLPQFIGNLLNEEFLKTLLSNNTTLMITIGLFASIYTVQALSSYLIGECGSDSLNRVQNHIYESLLSSSVKDLDEYKSGDLASRLTNDISIVLNFITVVLPNLLLNAIVIIGSVYFLFRISFSLTMMSMLLLPILLAIIVPINNKLENQYNFYQKGLGEISSRISHKFTHIRLMKAFNGEKSEQKVMSGSFDKLTNNFKRIIKLSAIQNALVNSSMLTFIIVMLVVSGMEVSKGTMTMSTLMTFILYMTQLIDPVRDISESMTEVTEFSSVSNRLVEILDLHKEEGQEIESNIDNSNIEFNNVTFAYEKDKVLDGLSMSIKPGQHVAIVGPSGSGKSTIFSLLLKFYQNYTGHIRVGDKELSDLSEETMRNLISYIPQDNTLFYGTIRENLFYGKNKNVSEERLAKVLNELGLTKLVNSLEQGLDTLISDSGTGLSEGQKQRFNIARALLLEHPIYLLDEVTSSLDSVTERIISKAIDKLTSGKTRLTIAHRLHTVKEADSIIVLDKNGFISDQGTHNQLLKRNNLYQEFLFDLQKAS
jgi:ATP-binding cassette subfamily B protein AbcA/BmrA